MFTVHFIKVVSFLFFASFIKTSRETRTVPRVPSWVSGVSRSQTSNSILCFLSEYHSIMVKISINIFGIIKYVSIFTETWYLIDVLFKHCWIIRRVIFEILHNSSYHWDNKNTIKYSSIHTFAELNASCCHLNNIIYWIYSKLLFLQVPISKRHWSVWLS